MFPVTRSAQSRESTSVANNSPSLSPVDVDEEARGAGREGRVDEENEEEAITSTLIMMGAGEPVRTNQGSSTTTSSLPTRVLSKVHVEEDETEKTNRSFGMVLKTKALHFTVSLVRSVANILLMHELSSKLLLDWVAIMVLGDHGYRCDCLSFKLIGPNLGNSSIFSLFSLFHSVACAVFPSSRHCHLQYVSFWRGKGEPYSLKVLTFHPLLLPSPPVVFSAFFLARYYMFPQVLPLTIRHSQKSMFLGTIPMGLITITSNICQLGSTAFDLGMWPTFVALGLWFVCLILSTLVAVGIPWSIVTYQKEHRFEATTAALLLPIVPPITAAATGSVLTEHLLERHPTLAFVVWNLSYIQLGIGLPLALMVRMSSKSTKQKPNRAVFTDSRRICLPLHDPDPSPLSTASHSFQGTTKRSHCVVSNAVTEYHLKSKNLTPLLSSVFLPLGPCGQGGEAALHLGITALSLFPNISSPVTSGVPQLTIGVGQAIYGAGLITALMLFALGMWWALIGTATFAREWIHGRLNFNMGFWSFVSGGGNNEAYRDKRKYLRLYLSFFAFPYISLILADLSLGFTCNLHSQTSY
jgi:tellurite resistance protein TehA-like permease